MALWAPSAELRSKPKSPWSRLPMEEILEMLCSNIPFLQKRGLRFKVVVMGPSETRNEVLSTEHGFEPRYSPQGFLIPTLGFYLLRKI